MKKLKNFWHNNSVLLVLLVILVACLTAISVVVVTYFVGDANSKYGDRLEGIKDNKFDKEMKEELIAKIEADDLVEKVKIKESNTKTIYVTIEFAPKTSLVEAQSKALASLEYFSENISCLLKMIALVKKTNKQCYVSWQLCREHPLCV